MANLTNNTPPPLANSTNFHLSFVLFLLAQLVELIVYSMSQKSSPPQKKLFAVFSLLVNLCNCKLSWLLPKHIPMSTPILVRSIYLNTCVKCIIFTGETPQILRIQFSLLQNL